MGTRSNGTGGAFGGGRPGGGALRLVMDHEVHCAGPGGIVLTVWTPGQELTPRDHEELHDYLLERWGATFEGSIGSGS